MKILILGGNRFVGKKVAETLVQWENVTVFNRSGTGPKNCNIIKGDRNTFIDIDKDYDIIVDFCLYKKEQAIKLVKKLKENQKYIFISSAAVYKNNNCLIYNEDMPIGGLDGFGNYGIEKAECEEIINNSSLDYITLRPSYIIGQGSIHPRIRYYINKITKNEPVEVAGDGNKILTFIWIHDIVSLIVNMVRIFYTYKSKTAFNVVSEDFYSSKSLISEIASFLNMPYTIKENGENAPFKNEHLMLSPLKLGQKFSTIKQNLPSFHEWAVSNKKYE